MTDPASFIEDSAECTRFNGLMIRDYLVIFPVLLSGNADIGSLLPIHYVPEHLEGFHQFRSVNVTGLFHRAKTSSHTKYRRTHRDFPRRMKNLRTQKRPMRVGA